MDPTTPLPHAPMAEKGLLSLMFRNPGNIARAHAEGIADAFHLPGHQMILDRLAVARDRGMVDADGSIDLTTFIQQAALDGTIHRMGGPSEVYEAYKFAAFDGGWNAWAGQLRECKARRIALLASQTLSDASDSTEAMETLQTTLDALKRAVAPTTRSLTAKQACDEFIASYVATYENGELPGTSTGIGEIDAITGGMRAGELWVVGGPSSSGKSVLMYQVESEFLGEGKIVANFSAELMARELVGRLVTLKARVQYDAITTPRNVTKDEMRKVQAAIAEMSRSKMWIDASSGHSIASIQAESERIRDIEGRVDLIVVDYIQIIKGIRNKGDSREQEIASISGGLKQLAKKLECPIITGTQLNDDGKTRESRAIEQDADVLMLIQEKGLLLKKVRNGQRDQLINLALDGANQRFKHFVDEPTRY